MFLSDLVEDVGYPPDDTGAKNPGAHHSVTVA
jgi:hypothetical protein